MAKPTYLAQVNAMSVNRLGPLRTAARLGWFLRGEKVKLMVSSLFLIAKSGLALITIADVSLGALVLRRSEELFFLSSVFWSSFSPTFIHSCSRSEALVSKFRFDLIDLS